MGRDLLSSYDEEFLRPTTLKWAGIVLKHKPPIKNPDQDFFTPAPGMCQYGSLAY